MRKSYVGFGFGPIQTGLMLLEAMESGNFDRYTIAEVDPALVEAVRSHGNAVTVNVARRDGILRRTLSGFWIGNPHEAADRERIARAIGEADELATAVPSVKVYTAGGRSSIAALLAGSLNPGRDQILYAAENHNYAAEILTEEVGRLAPPDRLARFQALNTVIGKMSQVIQDPAVMAELGLAPLVPGASKAVLVEAFNRILVSRVRLPGYRRGIEVFEEKEDLLPFEEAKLYGHNAIHALLGYLAALKGYRFMSEIARDPPLLELGRAAFLEECGAALIRRHGAGGDPLFTPEGWRASAEDLLERMVNPWLRDQVEHPCRDPVRKLGYGDRLFGAMRLALAGGIRPARLALGAAAALRYALRRGELEVVSAVSAGAAPRLPRDIPRILAAVWEKEEADPYRQECIRLVVEADARLD